MRKGKEKERIKIAYSSGKKKVPINEDTNLYDVIFPDFGQVADLSSELGSLLLECTKRLEHFTPLRFDKIFSAALMDHEEFFKSLSFDNITNLKDRKELCMSYDGFLYDIAVLTRKHSKICAIEVKLPNDGYIYRELKTFGGLQKERWHNLTDWKILSEEQEKFFPTIVSYLNQTVFPLFRKLQKDIYVQFLYHEDESRFDIVVDDDEYYSFAINFEKMYPVYNLKELKRDGKRKIVSDIQIENLVDKYKEEELKAIDKSFF